MYATGFLAIDPGAKTGIAFFVRSNSVAGAPWYLAHASVISPDEAPPPHQPDVVLVENPQIYPHSKVRPSDILTLARIVGRYEERYKNAVTVLVTPHEWKGSIGGDIMTDRIEKALSAQERIMADHEQRVTYRHNMLDAIGLGKWFLTTARGRSILR